MVKVMYTVVFCLVSLVLSGDFHGHARAQNCNFDTGYTHSSRKYGRKVHLKQGVVQGVIVEPRINHELRSVEQFLGIPYAAPPIGELRFMPPGSAPAWPGVKCADMMGPVCPQKVPDVNTLDPSRKDYFTRLLKLLQNQSEDCLYLNIYVPIQEDNAARTSKYPVMVYIHGESFEWSSGNPYDGSVLAAYGKVIVVTLNFRLGILGFLKVGLEETSRSNFGLVDQVAALLWVQENIFHFGGDPNSITLFGHGTGAACISLLMLSPMVPKEGKPLFHRAILMSGTALSDWALASSSRQVTYQVAEALNCPSDDKLAACLRKKRLTEIMDVVATTSDYSTKFGPIVDGLVIPNDPAKIMTSYNDFFKRFELMYGVTEVESVHLLPPVGLAFGLLEKERDQELRKYFYTRCEYRPENCVAHTLAAYALTGSENGTDGGGGRFTANQPDKATLARDLLLDMLSDARTVAPIALTAKYHVAVNPQSYFYVFGHTTSSREFIRNKTTNGEELPYVFGVPLDGPKFHFGDHYNGQEKLFSEVVMTLWTNFAYSGDPNVPRKNGYLSLTPLEWRSYEVDWPEYDIENERYLYLGIPLQVREHYRSREVNYWNEVLPSRVNKNNSNDFFAKMAAIRTTSPPSVYARPPPKNIPKWFPYGAKASVGTNDKFARKLPEHKPNDEVVAYGKVKLESDIGPRTSTSSAIADLSRLNALNHPINKEFATTTTVIKSHSHAKTGGTAMIVLIAVGGVFLLVNVVLFVALYYKCTKLKNREEIQKRIYGNVPELNETVSDKLDDDPDKGCGLMKMISKSSRSEDTYEAVKISESGGGSYKLSRQMSASTIDPHTKVRDWIAHEIVQRCSPKFFRRPTGAETLHVATINSAQKLLKGDQHELDTQHVRSDSKTTESYSTLGKSPTRPVTPSNEIGVKPKAQKVSVGIDATPAARSPSILRQQPIELTKSLDYSSGHPNDELEEMTVGLKRAATDSDLAMAKESGLDATIVKIEHHHPQHQHSKSEPDAYGWSAIYAAPGKRMRTFDPQLNDVNVTSRDEEADCVPPLTPEESLQTIKRRNFPKVLPDYPDRANQIAQKRRSMPVAGPLFMPIPEHPPHASQPNSPNRCATIGNRYQPPAPPPRCSTLGRKPTNASPIIVQQQHQPNIQSPVKLAEEPPTPPEPEITCNNLYVGPLIPKDNQNPTTNNSNPSLDLQPIYDNLRIITRLTDEHLHDLGDELLQQLSKKTPRTIITTDPDNPIKKVDPKIIIKPTINRNLPAQQQLQQHAGDCKTTQSGRGIPRVLMKDSSTSAGGHANAAPSGHEQKNNAAPSENQCTASTTITSTTSVPTPKSQRRIEQQSDAEDEKSSTLPRTSSSATATAASPIAKVKTPSQIPKLIKNSNPNLHKESSSESSPSEESETGTVIKRI